MVDEADTQQLFPGHDRRAEVDATVLSQCPRYLPIQGIDPRLELIVDRGVATSKTMYFNAGRLDRSIALETEDYLRVAKPQIANIALP